MGSIRPQLRPVPRGWPEEYMSLKRRWLSALFLLMLAGASFGGAMNPKEIEDLLHVMNETEIEFTIHDESNKGDGN
jgi:hypothetical protein